MSPVTAIQPIAKNDLLNGGGLVRDLETSLGVQLVLFPRHEPSDCPSL